MKIRFNPETQDCEMLVGHTWRKLGVTDAPGDYCAFEIAPSKVQQAIPVVLTEDHWLLVQQAAEHEAPHLNATSNRRLLRNAARKIADARTAAKGTPVRSTGHHVPDPAVPSFEKLLAWCEEFDGDPTEGWLHRILTGEISVDDFNRAVLTGTAPEGV